MAAAAFIEALNFSDVGAAVAEAPWAAAASENAGGLAATAGFFGGVPSVASYAIEKFSAAKPSLPSETRTGLATQTNRMIGSDERRNSGETRQGTRFRIYGPTPQNTGDGNEPDDSQSNMSGTKRAAKDGNEVPVIPPPKRISKITPDYFTIDLPYFDTFDFHSSGANITSVNSYALLFRLNSVYDPFVGTRSNTQPLGRDNWATMFQYYRVLSCNVTFTFHNYNPSRPTVQAVNAAIGLTHGDPREGSFTVGFEFTDNSSTTLANTHNMFVMTKHAKRARLPSCPVSYEGSNVYPVAPTTASVSHHYTPHSWDYHVQGAGTEERWTPISQNPTNDHYIALRAFALPSSSTYNPKDSSIYLSTYATYTVQFREASQSLLKTADTTPAAYGGVGQDPTDTTITPA